MSVNLSVPSGIGLTFWMFPTQVPPLSDSLAAADRVLRIGRTDSKMSSRTPSEYADAIIVLVRCFLIICVLGRNGFLGCVKPFEVRHFVQTVAMRAFGLVCEGSQPPCAVNGSCGHWRGSNSPLTVEVYSTATTVIHWV
jgi:hypothetical protein